MSFVAVKKVKIIGLEHNFYIWCFKCDAKSIKAVSFYRSGGRGLVKAKKRLNPFKIDKKFRLLKFELRQKTTIIHQCENV